MRRSRESRIVRLVRTSEPRPARLGDSCCASRKDRLQSQHNLPREHQNERTNILLADRRVLSRRILGRCTTAGPCGIDCHVPCGCSRRTAVCGEPKRVGHASNVSTCFRQIPRPTSLPSQPSRRLLLWPHRRHAVRIALAVKCYPWPRVRDIDRGHTRHHLGDHIRLGGLCSGAGTTLWLMPANHIVELV